MKPLWTLRVMAIALAVAALLCATTMMHAQKDAGQSTPASDGAGNVASTGSTPSGAEGPAAAVPAAPAVATLAGAERLYRTGKLDEAERQYKALIATGSDQAPAYAGLARLYLQQKHPVEAYAAAAKAVELGPNNPVAHIALGEVYFRQGKIAEAQAEVISLVRSGVAPPQAYLIMARIYRAASYYKQARQMLDMAHKIDPRDPDVQAAWFETLTLDERIASLREYLSVNTSDDAKERQAAERQLTLLQEQASRPSRKCRLTTQVPAMETELKQLLADANHLRGFGLNVSLNGTSANLLLDTGAGGILVDRKVAERAGIKRVVDASISGIGDKGDTAGFLGYADSIKIGELEFQDCMVEVSGQSSIVGDDGLIGGDVFAHFLVDLDFADSKFRLSELPAWPDAPAPPTALESKGASAPQLHDRYVAPEMKSYTTVLRFGHDLLIPTRMNDSAPKWFVIDTGAFNNSISPIAAKEVTKISADATTQVKGLSGSVSKVFRADQVILQFANVRQMNQDTVAFDTTRMSDSIGIEISGMLGFAMLRVLDMKIDYRDGLVNFTYDPNRWR